MTRSNQALLVIDVQNDFCPGGALAVADGDHVVARANALMGDFGAVIFTQDWHPANHSSFASQHDGLEPFTSTKMPYGTQVLWPDHCIQGSQGAAFHPELNTNPADLIIRKGFRPGIDSYSAFYENDHETVTGLDGYLQSRGFSEIVMVGLATDFCVHFSAVDAARLGYAVTVDTTACRAIDLDGSLETAMTAMKNAGVRIV